MREFRIERLVQLVEKLPCKVIDITTPNKWGDLQLLQSAGQIDIDTARREKDDMVVRTPDTSPEKVREIFS